MQFLSADVLVCPVLDKEIDVSLATQLQKEEQIKLKNQLLK
jgi:hypothetical protein